MLLSGEEEVARRIQGTLYPRELEVGEECRILRNLDYTLDQEFELGDRTVDGASRGKKGGSRKASTRKMLEGERELSLGRLGACTYYNEQQIQFGQCLAFKAPLHRRPSALLALSRRLELCTNPPLHPVRNRVFLVSSSDRR